MQPRGERGAAVEASDASRHGDERLLGGVECVLGIAHDAATDRVHAVRVTIEQEFERPAVAGRRAFDQRFVRVVVRAGHLSRP